MTYRGQVRKGAVVLDPPAELPEGATVEVSLVPTPAQRPPLASIELLRSKLPSDSFGAEFEETIRMWRGGAWRAWPQEPLE